MPPDPQLNCQKFVEHTEYKVIEIIKGLVDCGVEERVRAQKLQEICHMFSQPTTYSFLTTMKGSNLCDILLVVQNRGKQLNQDQLIGLVMASIALGGACWQGSIKMLNATTSNVRSSVLGSLLHYLKNVFSSQLSSWVCAYWEVID